MGILDLCRLKLGEIIRPGGLECDEVEVISARPLAPEEAIGSPDRRDFPLLKGKEVMIQANFRENAGQAYTDMPGSFRGTLADVMARPLDSNFDRAVFIATCNAVMRHLGLVDHTVHCRNNEPEECARLLGTRISSRFENPRIAIVGLQPAMATSLAGKFRIRVTDMDPANIGAERCGVLIESAEKNPEVIEWADLVLATGTVIANGTIEAVLRGKPTIFYGVTAAGPAKLMGYERYCPCSH
ncbi:MAG: DUF364 domain-containing protein [Bacillota bacterium]